jgi:hypothetical protein
MRTKRFPSNTTKVLDWFPAYNDPPWERIERFFGEMFTDFTVNHAYVSILCDGEDSTSPMDLVHTKYMARRTLITTARFPTSG